MTFDEAVELATGSVLLLKDKTFKDADEQLAAFARMKAHRDALLAVVKSVEYKPFDRQGREYYECPCCYAEEPEHEDDCALAAALKMEAP